MANYYHSKYTGEEIDNSVTEVEVLRNDVEEIKTNVSTLENVVGNYSVSLSRGYHDIYNDNGVTKVRESTDTSSSAYSLRLKSKAYKHGEFAVGTNIKCTNLATVRVWYATSDNVVVGYTGFVQNHTILDKYNGDSYDIIYIDCKNSDNSVMEIDYAKSNISITNHGKRCWTIHNATNDLYVLESGSSTPNTGYLNKTDYLFGIMNVPAGRLVYRDAVTDILFERLTWHISVKTVGDFAFGTKDKNGEKEGIKCLVSPANKTFKIYHSNWNGTDTVKRNLTFNFDIVADENYLLEIIREGMYKITVRMICLTDTTKTFEYVHDTTNTAQSNNKIRMWGGICFKSIADGQFYILEMAQKTSVNENFDLLIVGDSFVEVATTLIPSNTGFAYKIRDELGLKCMASGHGGATTNQLIQRLSNDAEIGKYKYVFINIGSNDSVSSSITVDTFKSNMIYIINYFTVKGVEPILITIPLRTDVDNTTFVEEANTWIKSLGYKYIDEYAIINETNRLSDGVHPSEMGNTCIYNAIKGMIPDAFY